MKNSIFRTLIPILFFLMGVSTLQAQEKYVTAAQIHISITHQLWPDVFINGYRVINSADHLFDPKSDITQNLSSDQLCYFLNNNCLGVEIDQTLGTSAGTNAAIGVAYVMKITFSDNTVTWITSDQGLAKKYHVAKDGTEPGGWASTNFDDSSWKEANLFIPTSMGTTLINPETQLQADYFKTFTDGNDLYMSQTLGEKFFFRRSFNLNVTTPPGCVAPRVQPPHDPTPTPTPVPPTSTPTPLPTWTALPTWTPRPWPTNTFTFTPWPTWTPIPPIPTDTPRPRVRRYKPRPTATPIPVFSVSLPAPTFTPGPQFNWSHFVLPTDTPFVEMPVDTPTFPPIPTNTFTPVPVHRKRHQFVSAPKVLPTATFTQVMEQDMGMATTIVFVNPPVNIDASFADGPGLYKLVIVDANGNLVSTLYDQQVFFEKETWISWDGTNDQGQLMHYGQYFALFSRNGRLIQKIALTWIPPNENEASP